MIRFLSVLSSLVLLANSAAAATHKHSQHKHSGHGAAELKLDNGRKWATDAPLREGMEKIRNMFAAELGNIHNRKAGEKTYQKIAAGVDAEIQTFFQTCKLSPEADQQLHIVLVQMMSGSGKMKSGKTLDERRAGAVEVITALGSYGEYFEHPGWKPLEE